MLLPQYTVVIINAWLIVWHLALAAKSKANMYDCVMDDIGTLALVSISSELW